MGEGVVTDEVAVFIDFLHQGKILLHHQSHHEESRMNMVILENAQHLWGPTCVGPVVESEQQFFGTARTVLLQFI